MRNIEKEIINFIPDSLQTDFVMNKLFGKKGIIIPEELEKVTLEYDGVTITVKLVTFLNEHPEILPTKKKEITDLVVCGKVSKINFLNGKIVISNTIRMVNMATIGTNYALDFDKLEKNNGFDIGVVKSQYVISRDDVLNYNELSYIEKRELKHMKWFGTNGFFNVIDDHYTRKPDLDKSIETLADQDIILTSTERNFDLSTYEKVCQHLNAIYPGEVATITDAPIRYKKSVRNDDGYKTEENYMIVQNSLPSKGFMSFKKSRSRTK